MDTTNRLNESGNAMTTQTDAVAYTQQPVQEPWTAAEVMSSPVVTVSTRETLWEAWGLLYRSGLRHLVVLDGTRCVGVVDDHRVVAEWRLGPATPHRRTVGEAMSRQSRAVVPATAISVVARIMLDERTDAIPVVTDAGDILGLITATDIVNLVACGDPHALHTTEKS